VKKYFGKDKGHSLICHVVNRGVEVQLYLLIPIRARPQPIYPRKRVPVLIVWAA